MAWSADQIQNGETIISVAKGLGIGTNGQIIGIMAALDESGMRNIDYGDVQNGVPTSSRGLFQQIAAWGPLADRENPYKAAYMFFTGGQEGQRGLLDITGWQSLEPWKAAQAVQQSEFSSGSNYQAQYQTAVNFVNQYGGQAPVSTGDPNTSAGFVANGVTIGDPVWKTYLTSDGTANFPGINVKGSGGITDFPPNRMMIALGDGTQIQIQPKDGLNGLATAEHMAKSGGQISRIDFDSSNKVTDYAGINNVSQSGPGNQDPGGAVADPALGIPDFLKNAPAWVGEFFTGIAMRAIYIGAGVILGVIGLYMLAQQAKPGVQAAAAPALKVANIIGGE